MKLGLIVVGSIILVIVAVVSVIIWTAPERDSVRAYNDLIAAANRGDLATAEWLCSASYTRTHTLKAAPEGGIEGLPRGIHKNFQAWRHGRDVWLCPMNRVGPVYAFVREATGWKFDGPVGILRGRGEFMPISEGAIP